MSELKKNQLKAFQEMEKSLSKLDKELLSVYRSSLTKIKNDLLKLNERSEWRLNELMKYDRLNSMQDQIFIKIKEMNIEAYKLIKKTEKYIYKNTYYRNWFGYEKELSVNFNFSQIDWKAVIAMIEEPYPNMKLKDMIKTIAVNQVNKLKREIGQSLLQGESIAKMTKRIENTFDLAKYEAERIARTEGLKASSMANLDTTKEAEKYGVKITKIWFTVVDDRTRDSHAIMNGHPANADGVFNVNGVKLLAPGVIADEAQPGGNAVASEVINCRCTYLEEIDNPDDFKNDDSYRDNNWESWMKS